jgi:hypothetical protein
MSRGTHVERVKFEFEGHPYTIFKRGDASASFEIDFWKYRQRTQRSLETPVKAVAIERAKKLIRLVKAARWDLLDASKLRASVPAVEFSTLGEIIRVYQGNKDELSAKAIKGNVSSLRIIVRTALGREMTPEEIGKLSSKVLTGGLIRDYKKAVLCSIAGSDDDETGDEEFVHGSGAGAL